jgi:hypothetical protein
LYFLEWEVVQYEKRLYFIIINNTLRSINIFLGYNVALEYQVKTQVSSLRTELNYTDDINCSSDDIFMTSYCLRGQFIKFFKYVDINNTNIPLVKFKQDGGNCLSASKWYEDNLKKSGFQNVERIDIFNSTGGHEFVVAHSNNLNDICILDQVKVVCG